MAAKNDMAPRASEIASSDTIVVKVGTAAKKYTLHKRLLAYHSSYFKGALSGRFRETDDGVVTLHDVDIEAFDIFVDWMYEKKVPAFISEVADTVHDVASRYHAYALADRLLAKEFKKALLDMFLDTMVVQRESPRYQVIAWVFRNLTSNDPLIQLVVDAFSANDGLRHRATDDDPDRYDPDIPHEGLVRLFLKVEETVSLSTVKKKLKREDYKFEA